MKRNIKWYALDISWQCCWNDNGAPGLGMKQIQNTANGVIKRKGVTLILSDHILKPHFIPRLFLISHCWQLKCASNTLHFVGHTVIQMLNITGVMMWGENMPSVDWQMIYISCNAFACESKPSYQVSCLTVGAVRSLLTTVISPEIKEYSNYFCHDYKFKFKSRNNQTFAENIFNRVQYISECMFLKKYWKRAILHSWEFLPLFTFLYR